MTDGHGARAHAAAPLPRGLNVKLSVMMFLQYGIWGAWLPLLWPFLNGVRGMSGGDISWMFMAGGVGALVAPFIAGQLADRMFSTEKMLAFCHIAGGVLVWQLAHIESFWVFLGFSLVYSLAYSPTLALTNSLAFHHMPDRDRDFGKIRVWGTIGWIVVGIAIGQWLLARYTPDEAMFEAARQAGDTAKDSLAAYQLATQQAGMADAFRASAILGILMGAFCLFFLPHTPPVKGEEQNAVAEAVVEATRQPLLTLFLLAVPVSCIHQFYFVHTAGFLGQFQVKVADSINQVFGVGGGGLMTVGQMSEVIVLALIPLVAKSLSRKSLLAIGLVAYAGRMALFAYTESVILIILGIALHGLCFGCFIFVAFMIVDEETTPDVRASAQSLFNLVIVGIGIIVGSLLAGLIADAYSDANNQITDYTSLFSWPMWGAIGCLVVLLVAYPGGRRTGNA